VRTHAALFVPMAVACLAGGCRKKHVDATPPVPSASSVASVAAPSASAAAPPMRVEKFVAARAKGQDFELAAVARDRTVVLSTLDATLRPRKVEVLAKDVEAAEGTEINLVGDGLVLFVGKIGGQPNAWVLRRGSAPLAITRDRCTVRDGVAWIARAGGEVRVRLARANGDVTSPPIAVAADREVHLGCGPDAIVLTTRDGENLSLATVGLDTLASAPVLVQVEKEGELDDELRDRLILPRGGKSVLVVRVGAASVSTRELDEKGTGEWHKVLRSDKPISLREDADLVGGAVAPGSHGRAWFLVSEPTSGGACADGEPPRRIVLHELAPKGEAMLATSRPVIELPCGVEAIDAHLRPEATRASMWWAEPVDTKACSQPGLSASAVVTAQSDKPGAKRSAMLAEGITAIEGSDSFLAVVRPGGCAPWSAPDAGAMVLLPAPK